MQDAEVFYWPNAFSEMETINYFNKLRVGIPWQQDSIALYGKTHPLPRLTALFGETEKPYSYSGITMHPQPFSPLLKIIQNKTENISRTKFNTVLLNLYRDGNDGMGWHSDDEKELGKNPIIASVSFGAERLFKLRHKKEKESHKMLLENGSVLVLAGTTQHNWQHCLPKTKKDMAPRINLTFRNLK